MLTNEQAIKLLHLEAVPAMGCTEPVCVALCAADAAKAAGGVPSAIKIGVSGSIYKNAKAVAIPNFPRVGLEYAAAIGAVLAAPELGLELFAAITPETVKTVMDLVDAGRVDVRIVPQEKSVYVEADVKGDDRGQSVISDGHANIILTKRNGVILFEKESAGGGHDDLIDALVAMKISEIRQLAESLPDSEIRFLLDGRDMNRALADVGLKDPNAFGLAKEYANLPDVTGTGLLRNVMLRTVACAESRMTGAPRPVMSSAGSGNHGITTIIPVCEVADYLGKSEETLCRALAISHLINVYIKHFSGRLSPLCGCGSSAATAASAAIVWLLGGGDKEMAGAINNMAGSVTGMLCDGAKVGCAVKLGAAATSAILSAYWAVNGVSLPAGNGIDAATPEETIRNIGRISLEGMRLTDETILDIMSHTSC